MSSGVKRWVVRETTGIVLVAVILFGTSGRLDWVMGWVLVATYAVWVVALAAILIPRNPQLLTERIGLREGTKRWDLVLLGVVGLAEMAKYVVAGLDIRWGWSTGIPLGAQVAAAAAAVLGQDALGVWSMVSNAFFYQTVRVQPERGHTVQTGGPYRYVRHPGYLGTLLFHVATPFLLGSLWACIPGGTAALLVVVRTALEDRTLQEELPGYTEYTRQVRYRLLPGIW